MSRITEKTWSRLPFPDYRVRFFLEVYIEKLRMQTPHFHQARLMNIFSCCSEVLMHVGEHRRTRKNSRYLQAVVEEFKSCWEKDSIANILLADQESVLSDLLLKVSKGDTGANNLTRLEVLSSYLMSKKSEYSDLLYRELRDSVLGRKDLEKKDRNLSLIFRLTGLYITDLLERGFSPTYLYNRSEMLTRYNNYGNKNISEQFDSVFEKLKDGPRNFSVIFSIKTNKKNSLLKLKGESGFDFLTDAPQGVSDEDVEKLISEFRPSFYAAIEVEANDYVRAAWLGKEKLDEFVDFASAIEINPRVQVAGHCIVSWRNGETNHRRTFDIQLLTQFLVSESGTYLSTSKTGISDIFENLDNAGRDCIRRSLRYLRIARGSASLEQKLLSLWISLESLFKDEDETGIINNVCDNVPKIYAVISITRRVRYLRELFYRSEVDVEKAVNDNVFDEPKTKFSSDVSDNEMFALLLNSDAALAQFESMGNKEYAKYMLVSARDEIVGNASLRRRLKNSMSDVDRQIRRIYFIRNKIAHSGHHSNIRPQLVVHLVDYLSSCYIAIALAARAKSGSAQVSLEKCLQAYSLGSERVIYRCDSNEPISDFSELQVKPVI